MVVPLQGYYTSSSGASKVVLYTSTISKSWEKRVIKLMDNASQLGPPPWNKSLKNHGCPFKQHYTMQVFPRYQNSEHEQKVGTLRPSSLILMKLAL